MMTSISDKLAEVEALMNGIGPEFFGNKYKRHREWRILGLAARILSATKGENIKRAIECSPPLPDFRVDTSNEPLFVEIAEVLEAGRRRHEELKKRYSGELPSMWSSPTIKDPYVLLRSAMSKKLCKARNYPSGSWLLMQFSVSRLQMPRNLGIPWEQLIFEEVASWKRRELVHEFGACRFARILVLDSGGQRLVSIFPSFRVLHQLNDAR